jgi:hypothetical protein
MLLSLLLLILYTLLLLLMLLLSLQLLKLYILFLLPQQGGAPNYFPNSFSGPQPDPEYGWHIEVQKGGLSGVERYDDSNEDNFTQCAVMYNKVSARVIALQQHMLS